ncbi:solute carrier organic anion transporter family member 2A1-like [Lytechinus variegatus]|uniref:solute carrier organic anion transporter family member 2A1-like n=1 Tax=Lytechinus variegatus TaxID=7654 RepID=UPI001BB1EE98|nr:solute carrier organic anion transporter family member 2A1-like [Lytechinus variegatus]
MMDDNNSTDQSKKTKSRIRDIHKDLDSIPPEDTLCCCPPTYAPSWLQCLADPKVFTFHMMLVTSFGMMSFIYIGAVLTTIERNFQLDSAQSGAITIAADIISTLFVIPLSHYGQMGHRPRWIGTGVLVTAVGTMLCAVPHFVTDPVDPKAILTGSMEDGQDFCHLDATESWSNTSDGHDEGDPQQGGLGDPRTVWWIVFGQIISGIGNAPFIALVITYIDDSVKKHAVTAYTAGLFMAFSFGPSCGFLFAAFTTRLYVDFDRVPSDQIPGISQNDPRWIGAWWLGFVILSIILVILSIPIFFYPRTLPSAVKKWKEERKDAESAGSQSVETCVEAMAAGDDKKDLIDEHGITDNISALEKFIKGPLLALKRLVGNPTFMCLLVDETAFVSLIAIFSAFGVKYMETQFSLSPSTAALVTAFALGPSNIISNLISGYICRRFKFNSKQCGLFVVVCSTIGFILYPMGMLLGCDNVPIAGVTTSYGGENGPNYDSTRNGCNVHCACPEEIFQPVCGSNGLSYISPCHAGCIQELSPQYSYGTTSMPNSFSQKYNYTGCSCIGNFSLVNNSVTNLFGSPASTVEASSGLCHDSSCQGFVPVSILLAALFFFQAATTNPLTYINLRCVRDEDRSMALALKSVCSHFLGFFPAPIYFGAIINSVCIHWQITDGDRGSCWVYDNKRYRMSYFSTAMVLQGIAVLCLTCLYFSIKEKLRVRTQ